MPEASAGFFSFTEITDPDAHHSYNEWHQLDHMPEQFPLAGIVHGQRWVWAPRWRGAHMSTSAAPFDRVHYMTLYLMQEPLDAALAEFLDVGKALGRAGRFHQQRHAHLSGPFTIVDRRASERVLVSAGALPYRPHRGVHVIVESLDDNNSGAVSRYDDWWRSAHAPALCALDGVAGVWQFATSARFDAHRWRPGPRRIALVWIDGDLETTSTALRDVDQPRAAIAASAAHDDMTATLETITPWQWDWFDRS